MAVTERQTVIVTKDKDGNTVLLFPVTSVKYVEGAVRSVDGNEPDTNGNVDIGDYVSNIEIIGKTVTVTFKNGTTKTLTETVTAIPANSDLNGITDGGTYSCWLTSDAKTLINNPMSTESTGIILEVVADGINILQVLYGTLVKGMYTRRCNNGSWNEWKSIHSESSGSNVFYATCSTATATAAKVATVTSGTFSLEKGVVVFINATNAFTGGGKSVTLNVSSSGAKALYHDKSNTTWGTTSGDNQTYYSAGNYIACVYDGSYWRVFSAVTKGYTGSTGT